MERYERALALHRLLKTAHHPVTTERLMVEMACSRATAYRDLKFLREVLDAPVRTADGAHYYDEAARERFDLPGLWLTSDELLALLATHQLVDRTAGSVLAGPMGPLKTRVDSLLAEQAGGRRWPLERIRVIANGQRKMDQHAFRMTASAVLERRQLTFDYRARSTNERTHRLVSPQRLAHYRDNWYLDAWDHTKDALRSFSVDRMRSARILDTPAQDVPDIVLHEHLASAYGIFSGSPRAWAIIQFSPKAARWVADTHWHSKQEGRYLPNGRYELKLPYSNGKELLMDVLRYGADAEIIAPVPLREQARANLRLALAQYEPTT